MPGGSRYGARPQPPHRAGPCLGTRPRRRVDPRRQVGLGYGLDVTLQLLGCRRHLGCGGHRGARGCFAPLRRGRRKTGGRRWHGLQARRHSGQEEEGAGLEETAVADLGEEREEEGGRGRGKGREVVAGRQPRAWGCGL
ncbi:hypothetical protein BS78_05G144200 [Paspalum vaginatum]|nr:hypothetical protein BS78_05G144200 [Paspalum vaginatum]